ncbi:teichoic acid D-Ala incorporation-associated protein DltX [Enterococcus casseliflavus]|nr:teichoic acid D-Ala incorporation-associated protein DltX [Enterococcus casseliflavus]
MKLYFNKTCLWQVLFFIGKTLFYFCIILMLIYLYHYKNVQGGTFIYNEF